MAFAQPATFNEPWSDERVFSHLTHLPEHGENLDFYILYNAYKLMRASDFARLLPEFVARGFKVQAVNASGQTFAQVIATHGKQAEPFIELLKPYQ